MTRLSASARSRLGEFRGNYLQSHAAGADLDFVYHTIGTGTALPGMLAAKLSLGHPVKFGRPPS